jgi:hypothetical protein
MGCFKKIPEKEPREPDALYGFLHTDNILFFQVKVLHPIMPSSSHRALIQKNKLKKCFKRPSKTALPKMKGDR